MFWNRTKSEDQDAVTIAQQPAIFAAEPPAAEEVEAVAEEDDTVKPSAYGEMAFGLTRFGAVWIQMSAVEMVTFNPQDGCGAEVSTPNNTLHLFPEDAAALEQYMMDSATARGIK